MPRNNSAGCISIRPLDDLFEPTVEQHQNDAYPDTLPLGSLIPFKGHPFNVREKEDLTKLAESIAENGVVTPAIVRTRKDGGYELIAGHRRRAACRMAGLETMPALIREMDDDTATIIMVDSVRP